MDLPVYTRLLRVPRVILHIQKWVFPWGATKLPVLIGAGATEFLAIATATKFKVSLSFEHAILISLPAVLAGWLANRPEVDGRPIHYWLWAHLSYLFRLHVLVSLESPRGRRKLTQKLTMEVGGGEVPFQSSVELLPSFEAVRAREAN